MSGAGNDFVVVDNRSRKIKNGPKVARMLCDRRWGVGADGLLLLEKSRKASYKMMYYNADGSYGGMCGNGGRCIAQFAVSKRIARAEHSFEALGYVYCAHVEGSRVILSMKNARGLELGRKIRIGKKIVSVNFVDTGSPHVVVSSDALGRGKSVKEIDVDGLGREIRLHRQFAPEGTNANFIERAGANTIRMRTYERGVEAETLACGTGSIASAIVAARLWKLRPPILVIAESKKRLRIDFDDDGRTVTNVRLTGPAVSIFSGSIVV